MKRDQGNGSCKNKCEQVLAAPRDIRDIRLRARLPLGKDKVDPGSPLRVGRGRRTRQSASDAIVWSLVTENPFPGTFLSLSA